MGYHELSECTLTHAERVAEAGKIIEMLEGYEDELSQKEKSFIEGITHTVSVKQLFWLRDIRDRVMS